MNPFQTHVSILALTGCLTFAASANADQYAVQISATFDMSTATIYGSPAADNIWGVPTSSGNYTVTSSFTFDTAGADIVPAGTYVGGTQSQYDWYGISSISNFSVQFGTKTWDASNLQSENLLTFDEFGNFVRTDTAPLWFSPQAGIVAFEAWALDGSGYTNGFSFSQAEGGPGFGFTQATVSDHNAGVRGPITTTIQAVPEPEAWGLMLSGLCLVGFAARRRHSSRG